MSAFGGFFLFFLSTSSSLVMAGETATSLPGHRFRLSQSDHMALIEHSIPLLVNKTLNVCVIVREPFVIYNEPPMDSNETAQPDPMADLNNYSGVAIEVVKRLKLIFGFNIRITRPSDGQFGVLNANKKWTGLIGSLVRNESDMGVTALSVTVNRAQVVDFTRAYYVETAAILLRIPEEEQNYFAIFEPFSLGVWLLLLASIVTLIGLITLMTRLEEKQLEQERVHKVIKLLANGTLMSSRLSVASSRSAVSLETQYQIDKRLASLTVRQRCEFGVGWLDKFYYATSCVLNILLVRDIKNPPRQSPIRILVCLWWLSTIVIVNIYVGILFGQLVVPRRPNSIETLDELVSQQQVEWCVTSGTGLFELFKSSPASSIYGQVGTRMHNVTDVDQGIGRVSDFGWAFIRERSMLTFKVAQEHNRIRGCRMQLAKEEFFSVGFGLALSKGSPYLRAFDAALTLMIENGFVAHWQSMYWPKRSQFTECKVQPLREGEPLSMKHFISIYLVVSLLIGLSLCLLIYQNGHEWLFGGKGV